MRRADRFLQLVLPLSRGRVRASAALAERLGVSVRTVYRDIAGLVAQGTPIECAPGIGDALRAGCQLPPLMCDREELEAQALGAAWAARCARRAIGEAAERVHAKLDAHDRDEAGRESVRRPWPPGLYYRGRVWTLAAWCELRRGCRSFRVDRFIERVRRDDPVPPDARIGLAAYLARVGAEPGVC